MVFFSPSGTPLQNPYTILNINPPPQSCTDEEITKSFKKLMLQLHPDKQPINQSSENALFVSIKLHDVMDAKSFLLDGEYLAARREYDAKLIRDSQPPPPPPQPSPVVSSSTTVPGSNNNTSSNTVPPQQQGTSTRNTSTATTDKKTATQTSSSSAAVNNNSKNGKKKKIDEQIDKGSNNNKSTTKSKPTSNTSNNKQQAAPIPKKGTVKQWGKQYQKRDKTTTPRNTTDKTLSRGATPSVSSSTMNNNKTSSNRDTTTMKRRASLDNGKEDTINKDVATSNKPKRETQHKNKSESKNLNSKSKSCSRDAKKTTAHNNRTPSSMDSKAQRIPPKTTRSRTTNSSSAAFDDSCGDFSTTTADSMTSDDDRRHTYSSSNNYCSLGNNKPSSNRPPRVQRNRIPRPAGEVSSSGSSRPHYRSASTSKVQGVGNNSSGKGAEKSVRHKSAPDAATTSSSQHAQAPQPPPTATHTPINNFSAFKPAITILEQQYHCPLTKSLMITPVSDMEGNSYEKSAILKHLETSNKSPITGNILMPSDLREDTALLEKIRYTVKLKSRLNALRELYLLYTFCCSFLTCNMLCLTSFFPSYLPLCTQKPTLYRLINHRLPTNLNVINNNISSSLLYSHPAAAVVPSTSSAHYKKLSILSLSS